MSDSSDKESSAESQSPELQQEAPQISERDMQIASLGKDFSSFTQDGNFTVYFKLVRDRKEAEQDIREGTFFPDFVHQFFVDQERIFGYKRPVIRLFYSASRLKRYVNFDYEDKLSKEKDGIGPDDVMAYLSPILEDIEYTQDLSQFISEVESKEEKDFRPPGDLLHEFSSPYEQPDMLSRAQIELNEMAGESSSNSRAGANGSNNNGNLSNQNGGSQSSATSSAKNDSITVQESKTRKKYQIFLAKYDTKGFKKFQARMQTLIMWFIESANMIDFEDPRWDFFMVFEKFNPSTSENPEATSVSTEDRYYFAGYATIYRYYAYPDRTRPRVSQMLLLPPYRRNGLGTTLLQAIYDYYRKQPATLDITAEDPDEEFIKMRDLLDCKNCIDLPMFQPERLNQGWSEEIAKEAQDKLKLCQRQSRKVYEILKLKNIDPSNEEAVRKYRLEIKNRLNIPHQRLKLDCDKVEKKGYVLPEEMRAQRDSQNLTKANLNENYQELVKQYRHTIQKLNQPRFC